jgi:hypothetical protein
MDNLDLISERILQLERKKKKLTIIYVLLPIIIASVGLYIIAEKVTKADEQLKGITYESQQKIRKVDSLSHISDSLEKAIRNLTAKYWGIKSSILQSDSAGQNIEKGYQVDSFISLLIKEDKNLIQNNKRITLTYYQKGADQGRVGSSLQDYGFDLSVREGKNNTETNFLVFGTQINNNSVKLAALALLRAGVKLKAIAKFNAVGKANQMQIGSWSFVEKEKVITLDSIMNTQEFKHYPGL